MLTEIEELTNCPLDVGEIWIQTLVGYLYSSTSLSLILRE